MTYEPCPTCRYSVDQYCREKDAEIKRLNQIITEYEFDATQAKVERLKGENDLLRIKVGCLESIQSKHQDILARAAEALEQLGRIPNNYSGNFTPCHDRLTGRSTARYRHRQPAGCAFVISVGTALALIEILRHLAIR